MWKSVRDVMVVVGVLTVGCSEIVQVLTGGVPGWVIGPVLIASFAVYLVRKSQG